VAGFLLTYGPQSFSALRLTAGDVRRLAPLLKSDEQKSLPKGAPRTGRGSPRNWGPGAAHEKKTLTNSPGPKTRVAFLKEIFEEGNLTIANVRGRLKMNTFRDFRNFFLVLAALSGGRLAGLAHLKELLGRQ
jgi:hypothetical protein